MKRDAALLSSLGLGASLTFFGRQVEWGASYSWHGRGVPFPSWVSDAWYQATDHYGADVALAPFLSPMIGALAAGLLTWWFLYASEAQRKLCVLLLCVPFLLAIVYASGRKIEQARSFTTYYVLLRPAGWIPLSLAGIFSFAMLLPRFRPKKGLVVCLVAYVLAVILSIHFESTKGPIAGYGG